MNKGIAGFYAELLKTGKVHYPYELFVFIYDTIYQTTMAEKSMNHREKKNHLSPKKICSLFSLRMKRDFGPFAKMVLQVWRVESSSDIGNAVMIMAEKKFLKLAGNETLEDFTQAGLNIGS